MTIQIILLVLGALISWLITHCYYKKSLENQEEESSKQIDELKKLINKQETNSKEVLRLNYIDEAIKENKRFGTPLRFIDTLNISDTEKADLYDSVMMRIKGRLPKLNKYRDLAP